ncbi:MAG: anthranilate phosphoribosyltransferase [Chloroflexi bacterium]|nr:anthranilate phosphoribosyltransferase [Chloroflexota bacterium]
MFDDKKLREFGKKVSEVARGRDLTRQETQEMYHQVLLNEQPDLQQGAFIIVLTAKGETPEEIAGSWDAIFELDTMKVSPLTPEPLVENCGTGMDELKTSNISTAAAIVAAANGIYMAKHGARALTSTCGAVDILEALGVDVECDVDTVKRSIEKAGIGIFNGMSPMVHPQALGRILSQIRFGTILNIAASLANPALPRYGVRGVYSKRLTEPVARVMKEIGYKKALVVHGLNADGTKGMDEISSLGETEIAELHEDGRITNYSVVPEDFSIRRATYEELLPSANIEEEALNFLGVLCAKDHTAKCDIVCLNTAPILYLMGKVKDFKEGINKARETIESGQAIAKLRQWVEEQNTCPEAGLAKLDYLLARV